MQSIAEINVQSALQNEALFIEGIEHANMISNLISSFLNISISLNSPMTKSSVIELCKFIELLKV
jgi:WASH complex subunit 7